MTALPSYAGDFRGHPACPCLAAWLPVYEAELQRRGILVGPLHIYQLIGGAAASGGTHTRGGAFDLLDLPGGEDLAVGRQMGADAYWTRPEGWDGPGSIRHNHGVLTGCPHNEPARYQIDAVRAGFNGLGAGGRSAPDPGPRPLSDRTWRQGIEWANQQEDDMFDAAAQKKLDGLVSDFAVFRKNLAARDREFRKTVLAALDGLLAEVKDDATKGQVQRVRADIAALVAADDSA